MIKTTDEFLTVGEGADPLRKDVPPPCDDVEMLLASYCLTKI